MNRVYVGCVIMHAPAIGKVEPELAVERARGHHVFRGQCQCVDAAYCCHPAQRLIDVDFFENRFCDLAMCTWICPSVPLLANALTFRMPTPKSFQRRFVMQKIVR